MIGCCRSSRSRSFPCAGADGSWHGVLRGARAPSSMSCIWPWRTLIIPARRRGIRRPTASASGSTRRMLNEFYRVAFRKKIYRTLEELQADLDASFEEYNTSGRIKAAGVTARRRCRRFRTASRWRRRSRLPSTRARRLHQPSRRAQRAGLTDRQMMSELSQLVGVFLRSRRASVPPCELRGLRQLLLGAKC